MEENNNNSNYLVQGTILAGAAIIAKIIGMIYRIPLTNILGDEGNGYYTTANQIYTILLMISTFSLPLAVSKLVSERINLGQYKNAKRVFDCAMKFSVAAGGIMSLLTFFLAGVICSSVMKVDNAVYALRVISPAIFIFAIAGVFRGYFQGYGSMVPTAVSQLIEQIVNAFVSVFGAAFLFEYGTTIMGADDSSGPAYGAAGGTLGTVVSVFIALIVLIFIYMSFQKKNRRMYKYDTTKKKESDAKIYRAIIATILPVVFSTLIYNITPLLDQFVFNRILLAQGYRKEEYTILYGIYSGKFYVLANVPLALASSLAPSVVPALSAAVVNRDFRDAKIKVRDTMRYTMIITIPCAVGFLSLASPIMQLLFNDSRALTATIMQIGSLMIVFFAMSTLTTAVLQGISRMKDPVTHSLVALVIHLIFLYIFLKKCGMNLWGVVWANTIFAAIVFFLNSYSIWRYLHYRQEIRKTFIIPLISAGIMGAVTFAVHFIFDSLFNLLTGGSSYISNALATIIAIIVAIFVYTFFLIRLKGVKRSEILNLPKGRTICRMLRKIHFI